VDRMNKAGVMTAEDFRKLSGAGTDRLAHVTKEARLTAIEIVALEKHMATEGKGTLLGELEAIGMTGDRIVERMNSVGVKSVEDLRTIVKSASVSSFVWDQFIGQAELTDEERASLTEFKESLSKEDKKTANDLLLVLAKAGLTKEDIVDRMNKAGVMTAEDFRKLSGAGTDRLAHVTKEARLTAIEIVALEKHMATEGKGTLLGELEAIGMTGDRIVERMNSVGVKSVEDLRTIVKSASVSSFVWDQFIGQAELTDEERASLTEFKESLSKEEKKAANDLIEFERKKEEFERKKEETIKRLKLEIDLEIETQQGCLDDHQSTVTRQQYIKLRIKTACDEYKAKIPRLRRRARFFQGVRLLCTIAAAFLSSEEETNLTKYVAVITAAATAAMTWAQYRSHNRKVISFTSAVHDLESRTMWWQSLRPAEQTRAKFTELVKSSEQIIQDARPLGKLSLHELDDKNDEAKGTASGKATDSAGKAADPAGKAADSAGKAATDKVATTGEVRSRSVTIS